MVVTSDNPRSENPAHILAQIEKGLLKPAALIQVDRSEAIRQSIQMASPEDIILIAGKGHETYQEVQGVRHHFDDVEQAMAVLKHYREPFQVSDIGDTGAIEL